MYLSHDFALIVKFLHDFVFQGCPDDDETMENKIEYAARIYTKYFGSLVSFSTLNQPLFVYDFFCIFWQQIPKFLILISNVDSIGTSILLLPKNIEKERKMQKSSL